MGILPVVNPGPRSRPQPTEGEKPHLKADPGWLRVPEVGLAPIPLQELAWGHWGHGPTGFSPFLQAQPDLNPKEEPGQPSSFVSECRDLIQIELLAGGRRTGGSPEGAVW